jgi:hypothetical protein
VSNGTNELNDRNSLYYDHKLVKMNLKVHDFIPYDYNRYLFSIFKLYSYIYLCIYHNKNLFCITLYFQFNLVFNNQL